MKKPIDKLFRQDMPIGPNDRHFELMIRDHNTKNVYAMNIKLKINEVMANPAKLEEAFRANFEQMLKAVFKGGGLPSVSTFVVKDEKDDAGASEAASV